MDQATGSVQAVETEQEQEQEQGTLRNEVLAFKGTLAERALGARGTRGELLASESWIGPETWVLCLLVRRWSDRVSDWCRRWPSRWRCW